MQRGMQGVFRVKPVRKHLRVGNPEVAAGVVNLRVVVALDVDPVVVRLGNGVRHGPGKGAFRRTDSIRNLIPPLNRSTCVTI